MDNQHQTKAIIMLYEVFTRNLDEKHDSSNALFILQ